MSAPVYRSRFDNRYLCSYVALFLLFAVVAQPATAASRDQLTEGAKREGEIILYASMNVEEANAMIARFQAKYPFVKVKFNRAGNEKLLTKLFAEARAKGTFADAIQTLGFSMYTLQKKQMLGYYLSPENSFYPKEFKDEGYWTTVYTNPYATAYNSKLVSKEQVPRSYEDLLKPLWRGKMLLEPTKVDWFAGMLQIMGKEKGLKYMRDLAKQELMHRTGHELLAQLIAAGEASIDVNIPAPSVDRLKRRGAPIEWVAFPPVPATMVGIGITAQPPHPNAARLYVDFVLSHEGQKILADMGRYLARSEFMKDQAVKAQGLQMVPVNPASGEYLEEYTKTMRNIFGH
jgi:iron(III) transport system substrate-binding protein